MNRISEHAEYVERARKLASWAAAKGCAGVVLTSPHAICYYTGFATTGYYLPHVLLSVGEELHLLVRDFEEGNEHPGATTLHLWGTEDGFEKPLHALFGELFGDDRRVLYEDMGNFLRPQVIDGLRNRFAGISFVPTGREIDELRRIKSDLELHCSRQAGRLASSGLTAGLERLAVGVTERQASMAMLHDMLNKQGEFPASLPYAYFGARSWRRMHQPGTTPLAPGQAFYLECGGSCSRYAAATLRSGFHGKCPPEFRDLYAAALECFLELESSIRPGVQSAELDRIGSRIIGKAGCSELRLSKFGYSLGIAFSPGWGEAGAFDIDPHSSAVLAEKMVIHLVATLMSPKWGTVGLSETVEVTETGCASLTALERGLIEIA